MRTQKAVIMNKFKFYFILIITSITIFSCSKNEDSATVEPIRDYQTQYDTEIKIIEDYLKTNDMRKDANQLIIDDLRAKGLTEEQLREVLVMMNVDQRYLEHSFGLINKNIKLSVYAL